MWCVRVSVYQAHLLYVKETDSLFNIQALL